MSEVKSTTITEGGRGPGFEATFSNEQILGLMKDRIELAALAADRPWMSYLIT